MILQNKQTGVLGVLEATTYHGGRPDNIIEVYEMGMGAVRVLAQYDTLEELLQEWEDYRPKEPLIKDEKIRKAVRAWAEADDLDSFRVQNEHFNECKIIGYTAGINKSSFIGFQTTIAHADNTKRYTIAELCGEEEEEE